MLTSFPVDLVCMTDDRLWLSLLCLKGPEGQRGPAGTRVSLLFLTASLTSFLITGFLKIYESFAHFLIYITFTSNAFNIIYFQGDSGERGAPGEKVWNQCSPTELTHILHSSGFCFMCSRFLVGWNAEGLAGSFLAKSESSFLTINLCVIREKGEHRG